MIKIGIVGVGDISGIYLENITTRFKELEIVALCDLVKEKAERAAEKYKIDKIYDTMHELFKDESIDIVLNLTRPYEHYDVSKAALEAGKNVYCEKPLATTVKEGKELVELAEKKGLLLGGAPDTFMGAGIQTCRKLIEDGYIGKPISATAEIICKGHENWHPDPAFYYKRGGGPLFDMGPYYLTALVNLLGGVKEVAGSVQKAVPTRTITSQPHFNEVINVDVPTDIRGILNFESGVIGTMYASFDVYTNKSEKIEIYGTEGTLIVPDPNGFGGPIYLIREDRNPREIPLCFKYSSNSRAMGLADMAKALETKRPFRANCSQTFHVLEIMEAIHTSSYEKRFVEIKSKFKKENLMLNSMADGYLE